MKDQTRADRWIGVLLITPYASASASSAVVMISAAVMYAGVVAVRGPVFPQTPFRVSRSPERSEGEAKGSG